MDDNKQKALAAALSQIEKQYGKGSIMKMDAEAAKDVQVVSTGSLGLDLALGVGGLPRGRVVEIYGPESSGKTTLTLQVIAEVQKMGGTAAFIDAENALDVGYAGKLGVKTDDLLISQPDTGEQALEIADMLVRSGAVDVIVIDSVAALTPKAEIEGEMGEPQMGLQARLMSQALRKLTANIKRTNTLVVFINQIRMKIGVMFGNPETTTGGNALKFYASVRMDIRRIGSIKKGDEVVGSETRVKVVKNKVSPPFKQAEFDIMYGEGISREGEVLEIGVNLGVLEKSGAWYVYNGDRLGQGKDNARDFLKDNPPLAREIEGKIREKAGVRKLAPVAPGEPAEDKKVERLPTRKRGGEEPRGIPWRLGVARRSATARLRLRRPGESSRCSRRSSWPRAGRRAWRCFRTTTAARTGSPPISRRVPRASPPSSTPSPAPSRGAKVSACSSAACVAGRSTFPTEKEKPLELRARALRYLARREHSRDELARKLSPYAESAEILEGLLRELESKKQLSNERFAEVRAHWLARKYGAARIRQDLKSKGVEDELVERVSSEGELERARAILKRKYHDHGITREERARRARFLQSRGFSYDTIYQAVRIEGDE